MQFPKRGSTGKYIPVRSLKTGCTFRLISSNVYLAAQRPAFTTSFTENI